MFLGNRQRAYRNQFRLFVNIGDVLPVLQDAFRPMLFHPDFSESQPKSQENSADPKPSLNNSYKMFSPTSPSPTRSMIKEANDHLQLLHHRVAELEKTVQEQAEALIKKDELMQTKIREVSDMKEAKIRDLNRTVETYEQRIKKLEQVCREKDAQIEILGQKCGFVEELTAYTPILERLLMSLKKLPKNSPISHNSKPSAKSRNRPAIRSNSKLERHVGATSHGSENVHLDGHDKVPIQGMADLRIGRSFSINQNFSMSEDEVEEYS